MLHGNAMGLNVLSQTFWLYLLFLNVFDAIIHNMRRAIYLLKEQENLIYMHPLLKKSIAGLINLNAPDDPRP